MKYLIAFLLATTGVFAQQKTFTITDSATKKPVPYASVSFNNGFGTYAGEDGSVTITDTLVKQVTITSIGYKEQRLDLGTIAPTVALEPFAIELKEVVVGGKKTKRKETVKGIKTHQDNSFLYMSSVGLQYAFLVAHGKEDEYLSKITLPLLKIAFEAEGRPGVFEKKQFRTLVKIEILENSNGLPGEKLYDFEQLAVVTNSAKDTEFAIALSEELPVAGNGMFVQLTILGRAKADGTLTGEPGYTVYKDTDGTLKNWAAFCQPNFPLVKRPKGTLTFVREAFAKDKKWHAIDRPHLYQIKKYPDFNIGFGYSTARYE